MNIGNRNAMGNMLRRTKSILRTNDFTALFDKGYHTGSEIKTAVDLGIDIMVAIPDVASHAPDINYDVAHFIYDEKKDTYTCPQNQTLTTNGNWYKKNRDTYFTLVKHYKTNACKDCPVKNLCTKNEKGRLVERSEHAPFIEQNKLNIQANPKIYKQRQAIIEHTYGIIKRQWGFYFICTKKGITRASADVGLMFTAYNFRRIINIVGKDGLKKFFQELVFFISQIFVPLKAKCFIRLVPNF